MKKMILINVITIIVLVVIGVLGFWFWHNTTSYVTTDNAKVDGDQIKSQVLHLDKLNLLMLSKETNLIKVIK